VEIDRGRLLSFSCDYATYLSRRQAMLEAEEKQWQDFDQKLAKEEIWIRQGVKARRTRNEGRVRALVEMRRERAARREHEGSLRLAIQEDQKSGRLVAEVKNVSFSYGEKKIIEGFSTVIMRGDRVGVIGPNGAGKTTLLRLLLGELSPSQGSVRLGARIRIAYFDQLRGQLNEERTVKENVSDGNDTIFFNGAPRHIVGYLQDFLFSPGQILAPVRSLSGGERNRLLLAKLFTSPANVLVLDEPTNDLDAETLELLEERLLEYGGTVLMVSHDREFLNNVVTSTMVFEGEGRLAEYVGGYDDWLRQREPEEKPAAAAAKPLRPKKERTPKEKTKLSYGEKREFEELPERIELLEAEKGELLERLNSPAFYADNDGAKIRAASDRLEVLEQELDRAYVRWDELDALSAKGGD
jgi:ATP-binding cassette subfamily F protein uup